MNASRGLAAAYVLLLCAVAACSDGTGLVASGNSGGSTTGGSTTGGSTTGGSTTGGSATGGSATGGSGAPSTAGKDGGGNSTGGAQAGAGGAGGSSGSSGSGGGGSPNAGTAGQGGTSGAGGTSGGGTGGTSGGGTGGTSGGGTGGMPVVNCDSTSPDASCTCAKNGDAEYWFCATFLEFDKAEAKCTAVGMHLPKIETAGEDTFLYSTAMAKAFGEYYLGGTDTAVADTWVWLAGGQFWQGQAAGTVTGFAHWNVAEPNDSGDCVVVQDGGVWDDRGCDDERKYICEAP